LLTGRLPYRPDDPRADGAGLDPVARVRWLHLNESPMRPSRLAADVPPAVEAVLGRALSKDPARRHANANAFAAALEVARHVPAADPWPASRVCVPTGPPVEIAAPTPVPATETPPASPRPPAFSMPSPPAARPRALWPWMAAGAVTGSLAGLLVF
jgi:serine/threonine-protein kinase